MTRLLARHSPPVRVLCDGAFADITVFDADRDCRPRNLETPTLRAEASTPSSSVEQACVARWQSLGFTLRARVA